MSCLTQEDIKGWTNNLPNFYDGVKNIIQLEGENAVKEFKNSSHINSLPDFMIAYHPECPHCKSIVNLIKNFAKRVEDS